MGKYINFISGNKCDAISHKILEIKIGGDKYAEKQITYNLFRYGIIIKSLNISGKSFISMLTSESTNLPYTEG